MIKFKQVVAVTMALMLSSTLMVSCNKKESVEGDTSQMEINTEEQTNESSEEDTKEKATPAVLSQVESLADDVAVDVNYKRVSVHDPSIVYAEGKYYLFGSHMAWAKSDDLMNWETFKMNINDEYGTLFGKEWSEYCKSDTNPELGGNLWAPDVIYNEAMNKYCMYMSVNGDDWNSVIVMLTADNIEGPYEYAGPIVYSGFNTETHNVELTDVYQVLGEGADLTRYQSTSNTKINAIDPCVKYDNNGDLWMSFGSWFGGIYLLKLDANTGLRDYTYTYETVANESDAYYGYKIAGGLAVSGEGSYIIQDNDYYYLFLSYGGLTATGGYQMRIFRSENIYGPYVDENGNSAVYTKNENNLFAKNGIRIMGSYDWSGSNEIRVAQGHNSVIKTDDGKIFCVYHSRFADGKGGNTEAHEVRVQQMFANEDGWLICAPYEYSGETITDTTFDMEDMAGDYEFIIHTQTMYYQESAAFGKLGVQEAINITLNEDGTVTGDKEGTWTYKEGTNDMSIVIDNVTYKGKFIEMANERSYKGGKHKLVMTFSALGDNICVWGSKQ